MSDDYTISANHPNVGGTIEGMPGGLLVSMKSPESRGIILNEVTE